jgi:hypothetical protein
MLMGPASDGGGSGGVGGPNFADASQPKNLRKFCKKFFGMGVSGSLPIALDPTLTKTCSQTWLELLMDCPFLLGRRKGIPQTREEKNDQVNRCCWLCLSRRNFGASNNASAYSSTRWHDHASSLGMRPR